MVYIGIDPGVSGAMAIRDDLGIYLFKFDEEKYVEALKRAPANAICCHEHVHSLPKQGDASSFNFGMNLGCIQGALQALGVRYELFHQQKWKKEFSVTKDKNTSIEVCKRLFPDVSLKRTENSKKDDDGFAEALLMAEYARRRL